MTKKKIFIFLLILNTIIVTNAFGAEKIRIGLGFINNNTTLDSSEKIKYKEPLAEISVDYNSLKSINYIGPNFSFAYIPVSSVPIGLKLTTEILFPIGYNKTNTFRSYNGDLKNRNMIGIIYEQTYTDKLGLFAEIGYEYDIYRIAKENKPNIKRKPEFNKFSNQAFYGELGFFSAIKHSFFKFGINYSHSFLNKSSSFDLIFTGGFKF